MRRCFQAFGGCAQGFANGIVPILVGVPARNREQHGPELLQSHDALEVDGVHVLCVVRLQFVEPEHLVEALHGDALHQRGEGDRPNVVAQVDQHVL